MTSKNSRTIVIAFLAFIAIGFASGLLGLAWPSMQKQFGLPLDGVNTLILVQTLAYTVAGFYIGRLMARFGSGTTLLIGSSLFVLFMFGVAVAPTWTLIVALGVVDGLAG